MRDWEKIKPYKNRKIDFDQEVRVYRCLPRKGKIYSIWQNGLVVGHTTHLSMTNCKFIVSEKGNMRCKTTNTRNVHAYIEGKISKFGTMGVDALSKYSTLPAIVIYNPFEDSSFMIKNLTVDPLKLTGARGVIINHDGVSAAYTNTERIL